mmetsp:Transcript_67749/g.120309  ORF Transcript_67749/g.120309 Transcript_67749/m.120309 type:complete len:223 (+) Transcript_67749:100-768(+)
MSSCFSRGFNVPVREFPESQTNAFRQPIVRVWKQIVAHLCSHNWCRIIKWRRCILLAEILHDLQWHEGDLHPLRCIHEGKQELLSDASVRHADCWKEDDLNVVAIACLSDVALLIIRLLYLLGSLNPTLAKSRELFNFLDRTAAADGHVEQDCLGWPAGPILYNHLVEGLVRNPRLLHLKIPNDHIHHGDILHKSHDGMSWGVCSTIHVESDKITNVEGFVE